MTTKIFRHFCMTNSPDYSLSHDRWIFIGHKTVKRNCDFPLIFSFLVALCKELFTCVPRFTTGNLGGKKIEITHISYTSQGQTTVLTIQLKPSNAAIPNKVIGLYFIYLSKPIFTCICHLPSVNSGPRVHTTKISFLWLHVPPVIWQTHS